MMIEIKGATEEQLRDLAVRQGWNIYVIVEEAVREYLEGASITDMSNSEAAEAQVELLGELHGDPGWTD